ncbi:hypothetical protein AB0D27_08965 [Streptomyces sp. NPDC048415]|jgi:hypothetical protein|uniref:hypothetical protein n=1 Tax=Streptomyces sp. NPDC048415 TaxID=3154822 RepID=UPI0034317229
MSVDWPTTELDPVRRLRVMAAGLNAVMYADAYLDLPFTEVWAVASDLERELPHLVPTLRAFRSSPTSETRQSAWAYGPFGHRARFDVLLQPGWCLMQSRYVVGGMAAVPEGSGTRFAVLGGLRQSWFAPLQKALRPVGGTRGRRMIARARHRAAVRHGSQPTPDGL